MASNPFGAVSGDDPLEDPMVWMWGPIDREEAVRMLTGEKDGTFLVRESQSSKGSYSISVVQNDSVRHVRLIKKDGGFAINKKETACPSLADLINQKMGETVKTTLAGGGGSKNSQLLKIPFPNPDKQVKKKKKKKKGGDKKGKKKKAAEQEALAAMNSEERKAELARLHAASGFGGGAAEEEEEEEDALDMSAPPPEGVKKGVKMESIADYVGGEGELSFKKGEKIFIVLKDPRQPKWQGVLAGEIGLVPKELVQEYDVEERKKDMDALQKKAEAAKAAGVKVSITRCIAKETYEAKGPGELTLAQGAAVMLPNLDEFESAHSPGVSFYRGVCAGQVGLVRCDIVEESEAKASAPAPAAAAPADEPEPEPEPDDDADGGDEPGVLEQMADKLFDLLKGSVDGDGCLGGKALQPVMSKCDPTVPGAMLGKIWNACDTGKAGKLNKAQVVKMLGFIGQVQSGATPNPNDYLSAPPPKITGLPIPAGAAAAAAAAAASAPAGPTLSEATTKLFTMFKKGDGDELSGGQLQPVMSKCDPPIEKAMLGKIWTVCDERKAGSLTKPQVMKMLGLMGQAQSGAMPNPAILSDSSPPPGIVGLTK